MDNLMIPLLVILTIVIYAIIFAAQIPLRKGTHRVARTVVFVVKILLFLIAALIAVAMNLPGTYNFTRLFGALYLALAGDIVASIVDWIVRKVRKTTEIGPKLSDQAFVGILGLALAVCLLIFGVTNALKTEIEQYTVQSDQVSTSHTFVFASDIHVGSSQTTDAIEKMVHRINAAQPDFVILGGDVTDELTSKEVMQKTYELLSEITVPVYFVYGNHDRQPMADLVGGDTYSDEELEKAIASAGIIILEDEFMQVDDELVLLGRADLGGDESRVAWEDLKNPYGGCLIVADHSPYDDEQLAQEISAVQVSGHTHAGQLWPLCAIYQLVGLNAYGQIEQPGTTLLVSAGKGAWAMPLRTELSSGVMAVTLEPK